MTPDLHGLEWPLGTFDLGCPPFFGTGPYYRVANGVVQRSTNGDEHWRRSLNYYRPTAISSVTQDRIVAWCIARGTELGILKPPKPPPEPKPLTELLDALRLSLTCLQEGKKLEAQSLLEDALK